MDLRRDRITTIVLSFSRSHTSHSKKNHQNSSTASWVILLNNRQINIGKKHVFGEGNKTTSVAEMAATIDYTDVPVDKVCETCLFSEKKNNGRYGKRTQNLRDVHCFANCAKMSTSALSRVHVYGFARCRHSPPRLSLVWVWGAL